MVLSLMIKWYYRLQVTKIYMYAYSNLKVDIFTEILGMTFSIITVDNNPILMKYGFNT